jgi:hypothetical protein
MQANKLFDLSDKVALVTGGSRGTGDGGSSRRDGRQACHQRPKAERA